MKRYATLVVIALTLALSGCLDWEKQTIVVTMAAEKDELRAFFVYEGLHVGGSSESDLDSAKTSLKEQFDSKQKFCIFDNWPLCPDLTPPKAGEQGTVRSDRLATLNRNHIAIRNSGFFLNPEGRLSGWQQITIRNLGSYVEAANGLISEGVSEMVAKELQAKLDPNRKSTDETPDDLTLALLQRAAGDRHQWIRVEPGRVSFIMIGSPEDLAKLLRKLEELNTRSQYRSDNYWSVDQRGDRMTIALGYGDGEPIRVIFKKASEEKRNREDELSKFARSLPVPIRKQTSVESVIAEFLASVDR